MNKPLALGGVRGVKGGRAGKAYLLYQLSSLEETPQIGDLPHGQRAQTHHGGDAEEQHTVVGGSCWETGDGGKPFRCQTSGHGSVVLRRVRAARMKRRWPNLIFSDSFIRSHCPLDRRFEDARLDFPRPLFVYRLFVASPSPVSGSRASGRRWTAR